MGSPPLRRLALILGATLALSAWSATAASARPAGADPRTTALAFLNAIGNNKPAEACAMFTPAALARLGGSTRCEDTFSQEDSASDPDFAAIETLARAFHAARKSASRRHGRYVTKQFTKLRLARDLERLDPELTVKLGRGPTAAAGQLATTAILDTRSTGRRLVFYAESDDGSILRLTVARTGEPDLDEVAFGVPEAPPTEPELPAFTATIDSVTFDVSGTAYAKGTYTVTYEDETLKVGVMLVLVHADSGYLVDDFLYSVVGLNDNTP
jgi:hypothetical protein